MCSSDLFLGFLGGLFLALHFATWITSLKFTSVASSVVLVTTNPLFVGFFSYLFFREKQPPALLAGIALSITGSVIMAVGDSGLTNLAITDSRALIGDGLALLGAILASAYLMVGARLRQRTDILTTVVLVYTFSAVILLLITLAAGLPLRGFSNSSYLYMVLLALVPQIIGHTTINWALQHLRTSMVAVVILGEPIGASILAYLIFRETVGTLQLVGIFLIFSAILLASRQGKRLDPGGPPPVSDVI